MLIEFKLRSAGGASIRHTVWINPDQVLRVSNAEPKGVRVTLAHGEDVYLDGDVVEVVNRLADKRVPLPEEKHPANAVTVSADDMLADHEFLAVGYKGSEAKTCRVCGKLEVQHG